MKADASCVVRGQTQALPAHARLRQSQDFRNVFAHGKRYVRAGFVVIVAAGSHDCARLGLAIAKRRAPRAVDRNRIKRVVRNSFRCMRVNLGRADIVVLARSRTVGMPNHKLFEQLHSVWLEAGATGQNTT